MMTPSLFNEDELKSIDTVPGTLSLGMTLYSRVDLDREAKAAAEHSAQRDGLHTTARKPVWTLVISDAGDGTKVSLMVSYRTTDQDASQPNHTTSMAI